MKNKILFVIAFLGLALLNACIPFIDNSIAGNGNVITENRTIGDFDAIEASAGLNVFVEFGKESDEVEVIADENLMEYIVVETTGGVLRIKTRKNIRQASSRDVFVKAETVRRINVSSAADLTGENILKTEKLTINVSSAGELSIDVETDRLNADISSSGSASLNGTTDKLLANVSSAGNLRAYNLIAREADINASSAGSARVHATEHISGDASSAGSIKYEGNPEKRNTSSSSGGSVSGK